MPTNGGIMDDPVYNLSKENLRLHIYDLEHKIKELRDAIEDVHNVLGTGTLCEHACEGCKVDIGQAQKLLKEYKCL